VKKIAIGCSIVLVVLVGLFAIGLSQLDKMTGGLCGNEVVQTTVSPDGRVKAFVFERDCGATTGFSTQISVVGSGKGLPNAAGNVFIADGDDGQIGPKGALPARVTWVGTRQLQIQYPERAVIHQQSGHILIGTGFLHTALVSVSYTKIAGR